ncbi:DUF2927 domain-containing protein [Rhodobacteraceae bacterium NNCM2]|nr:DUF2927 domain-containing protein [Coraliihabitans acroporae]
MRRSAVLGALALLAACGSVGREGPPGTASKPALPVTGAAIPAGSTNWSNASLAAIFTELTHGLEWGASRPALVRYEEPVRVAMEGPGSGDYTAFLDLYLHELRSQTGIDIQREAEGANLHVRFVDGARFAEVFPGISCVVAPGDLNWRRFRKDPDRYGGRELETSFHQTQSTIFIPQTAAPFRVRSCLIEEVAQALGPANDLYGLGPSIFNDDAAHIWPTQIDYLMLRVLYQPEMQTGLSRQETERAAKQVLDRLNPGGVGAPPLKLDQPRQLSAWRKTHQEIFAKGQPGGSSRAAATRSRNLAARHAPGTNYHCHSLRTLGRIEARTAPADALATLREAEKVCTEVHGPDDVRLALIGLDRAIALSRQGSYVDTLDELARHEASLAAHEHDERLVTLYNLRARAYLTRNEGAESSIARSMARSWAAYAYGQDSEVVARISEDEEDQ